MAWAAGTFSRIYGATGWTDDKNNAVKILASRHDTHDQDLADGINSCLTRDNQAKPTSSFLPATDNTINLGSALFRWAAINGVTFSNFARQDAANGFAVASVAAGAYRNTFQNQTATGYTSLRLDNSVSRSLELDYAGPSYGSALITGGPTGESAAIGTIGSFPLSLYTNLTERIRIDGAGASINLQATSVQVNGTPINVLAASKAAATSRSSTTTFASDPDLAFTSVPAGTYDVEIVLFFDSVATTGGIKTQLSMSGTVGNGILEACACPATNSVSTQGYQSVSGGIIAVYTMLTGVAAATGNWIFARGTVALSTTQNVALQWAQQTSSANATTLQVMSRMTLRRIS
jgi:hypothetical protein